MDEIPTEMGRERLVAEIMVLTYQCGGISVTYSTITVGPNTKKKPDLTSTKKNKPTETVVFTNNSGLGVWNEQERHEIT